jgi:hypothetical protein
MDDVDWIERPELISIGACLSTREHRDKTAWRWSGRSGLRDALRTWNSERESMGSLRMASDLEFWNDANSLSRFRLNCMTCQSAITAIPFQILCLAQSFFAIKKFPSISVTFIVIASLRLALARLIFSQKVFILNVPKPDCSSVHSDSENAGRSIVDSKPSRGNVPITANRMWCYWECHFVVSDKRQEAYGRNSFVDWPILSKKRLCADRIRSGLLWRTLIFPFCQGHKPKIPPVSHLICLIFSNFDY